MTEGSRDGMVEGASVVADGIPEGMMLGDADTLGAVDRRKMTSVTLMLPISRLTAKSCSS